MIDFAPKLPPKTKITFSLLETLKYVLASNNLASKFSMSFLTGLPVKTNLLVSKNLSKYHDYGDVTKVKIENNYINNLDKSIEKPNAYDTGFFIIDKKNYDTNIFFNFDKVELSKVHMSVADKQNLLPIYVEHSDWMDIDTEVDLKKAEEAYKKAIDLANDERTKQVLMRRIDSLKEK